MRDFYASSSPAPLDQADGLRRLFAASRVRFVPVVSNARVVDSGLLLEGLSMTWRSIRIPRDPTCPVCGKPA